MRRKTQIFPAAVLAIVALFSGCSPDASGPTAPARTNGLPALIVSPIIHLDASARATSRTTSPTSARSTASAAASGMNAYVSLPPGSVPDGSRAVIRDAAAGDSLAVQMVDGGFDPVAIAANIGDSLFVTVTRAGSAAPVIGFDRVGANGAPQVVRSSPPRGAKDVALNATIVMVFSAPLDSTTIDTSSIQLLRGTTRVIGTVRFADTLHLRLEFHPDSLLVPQKDYQLVVAQAVRDANGVALESAVGIPFTTGTTSLATNLVFSSVAVGFDHACGIITTGAAYCWGDNSSGELGTDPPIDGSLTPVLVAGGLKFASLSANFEYTCGVTTNGAAYCWGVGAYVSSPVPVPITGGHTFASVSTGLNHTCGVTTAGAAYCWGEGDYGELGTGPGMTLAQLPTAVTGGLTFAQVSAGGGHSCGVTTAGAAYCWGQNSMGELGIGSSTGPKQCYNADTLPCSTAPAAVLGGLTFATVSAGNYGTCGATTDGSVYCWGSDAFDLLGLIRSGTGVTECALLFEYDWGITSPIRCVLVPLAVGGPNLTSPSISFADGGGCGLDAGGAAYCWGNVLFPVGHVTPVPVPVPGGHTFATLSTGWFGSACGVTNAGVAYCWGGDNRVGQLGDGTTASSNVPVKVAGQP